MRIYHLVEAESLWALSQRGSVNLPQVKELQDRLRAAGYDPGPSDGWYGKKTADAVRAYQQANNLQVDGDAGPQTLSRLGIAITPSTTTNTTPASQSTRTTSASPTTTNTTPASQSTRPASSTNSQVDRAANQGGEELAQLIIAGLLGYGLYRAARQSGQNPPPLGSNPTPVIPGTSTPTPVLPRGNLVSNSSPREAAAAIQSVSQNEFELANWRTFPGQSFMRLELNPQGQLAAGYDRVANDYRQLREYESMVERYVRRQVRLIPGNIRQLSIQIFYRGNLLGSFDTYLG